MRNRKKIISIIFALAVLVASALPCFALDADYNAFNTPIYSYKGLDNVRITSYANGIQSIGNAIVYSASIQFYNTESDLYSAYPITMNITTGKQYGLLEYRPMRSVNLGEAWEAYHWIDTRVTFKDCNSIDFEFSDFLINKTEGNQLQQVELDNTYGNSSNETLTVTYTYTVHYFSAIEGILEKNVIETQVYNTNDAIIYLYPTWAEVPIVDQNTFYVKNLKTTVSGFNSSGNGTTDYKYTMTGWTEDISENQYVKWINDITDYTPPKFELVSSIFDDIGKAMAIEIFPNFSIGAVLSIIAAIPLLLMILKLFAGG